MSIPDSHRLRFRELVPEDYDDAASILLDDEIMRKMSAYVSETLVNRWLNRKLEQYRDYGYSHWHVSLKETGEFVGIIGIAPETVEDAEYTGLGYLIRREHQRKGYAYEGAQACLEWAFRELHPGKIIAEIDADNLPSRLLAEKLGMACEKEYLRFNGETNVPYCLYVIEENNFCPTEYVESY